MPKWGGPKKTEKILKVSRYLEVPPASIGAFPMPRLKEDDSLRLLAKAPRLDSFKQVWEQKEWGGDIELKKEVLSRKLQKGFFRR